MFSFAGSKRARRASGRKNGACSTARCSRITRRSNGRSHDLRGGPCRVPGARALRVSERGHARPAVTFDPRRVGGASALRPEPGARRKGLVRERARAARHASASELATLVGTTPDHIALTSSTTDACNIVASGLELGPGRRDRHHRLRASRPALAAPCLGRGRAGRRGRRTADLGGARDDHVLRHTAHEADRPLARPLDDRAGDAGARAEARERAAFTCRRCAVGGRDPRRRRRPRLLHGLLPEVALRPRAARGVVRPRP